MNNADSPVPMIKLNGMPLLPTASHVHAAGKNPAIDSFDMNYTNGHNRDVDIIFRDTKENQGGRGQQVPSIEECCLMAGN